MRHHRLHLIGAAAALVVALGPAMSATASADEQALPENTASAAPADVELAEQTDPAPPAESTEPSPMATDDATPTPSETVSDPVLEPEESLPVTPRDDKPSTEAAQQLAEGEDGHEGGGHGEGGTLPDGVTVTVDGRDITATDPEGSLPKIASCTFDITASGLRSDPPDTVGVRIVAWPPTAPGESRVKLIDVTEASIDGAWAGSFPLDEAVLQFDRKGNGYHMRLEILINGEPAAMKMYWLGCGEPQTGNPRRMLFDVQWYDAAGALVTQSLNLVLPTGWRDDFVVRATGERGTAECTYPARSDDLVCIYVNPGHGDSPGLVLPGKPGTEYGVTVGGVPDGWTVDATTIGTFLADDTCPKGSGGHDDGHEERAATPARAEGEEGHAPCVHIVTIDQQPTEPPDEGGGGDATPPDTEGGGASNPTEGDAGAGALPTTGATSLPLLPIGFALLTLGTVLVLSSRPSPRVSLTGRSS